MMNSKFLRYWHYRLKRTLRKSSFWNVISSISNERYAERIYGSMVYGLLSAISVKFFFGPGKVYSSGATGLAQILTEVMERMGYVIPLSLVYYAVNLPLLILAWFKLGKKFTIFTIFTVSFSSFFIQFVPQFTLTDDPLVNAIFGGLMLGTGIGFALKNNVSSGGTDIVSLMVRKRTGKPVGSISRIVNTIIMTMAGLTFGWRYALYSMIALFISGQMTDIVYLKQKRMQATIVTTKSERVIKRIHKKLNRGVTIINEAEGAYNHESKKVLITIITRSEFNEFKHIMKKADPDAFISVADNITIIGRFVEN